MQEVSTFSSFTPTFFPANLGAVSDKQGECFHQALKIFEDRQKGFQNESMVGDYCWSILRETDKQNDQKKRTINLSFLFLRYHLVIIIL